MTTQNNKLQFADRDDMVDIPNRSATASKSLPKSESTYSLPLSISKRKGQAFQGFSNDESIQQPAHALSWKDLAKALNVDVDDGLSTDTITQRQEQYGSNELGDDQKVVLWKMIFRQIANAMTLVLFLAMGVSFGIKAWIEGAVVTMIIVLNIVIGTMQEYQAEKDMDSLRNMSSPTANVTRDGNTKSIPTIEVVVGDMIELKLGDTVPADVRLVEAVNFETDEALLTGESLPVRKDAGAFCPAETVPGDRINVAYSTSTVTKGRARGIAFAIGTKTGIGSIAESLKTKNVKVRPVKRDVEGNAKPHRYLEAWVGTGWDLIGALVGINVGTPLQQKLSKLALLLFFLAIISAVISMGVNEFKTDRETIIYSVALGLSLIPASLQVILVITMANGTMEMKKRKVIVRNARALESLGSVTDICSDKTGTITQGKMIVARAWVPSPNGGTIIVQSDEPFNPKTGNLKHSNSSPSDVDEEKCIDLSPEVREDQIQLKQFLNTSSLANLAHVHEGKDGKWIARGDPTEIAIQVFATRFNWNRDRFMGGDKPTWKQIAEFPFDSSIKRMSVIFEEIENNQHWIFTKGAVERILDRCTEIYDTSETESNKMTDDHRKEILKQMNHLASLGLRTLALASRKFDHKTNSFTEDDRENIESNLVFSGLFGIYDPPRPESAPSVRLCHEAGILVHMLTGDHPSTAQAIAKDVGILPANTSTLSQKQIDSMVMTAQQFDDLTDGQIDKLPCLPLVIARCSPDTKVRMIDALHRRKKFAAMTGDGVNDAPSLNKADVGIAMGQAGSDVAKDASDIVLSDDNFASILNAVQEGRRMFENIQKFVLHLLAQNISQALVLLIGLAFKDVDGNSVFPISPVEIMWIIMVTSSLPDMGLGMEKASPNILKQPPKDLKTGIFTWEVVLDMLVLGTWIAALCLGSFSTVLYAFGSGSLGSECNRTFSEGCMDVFRARATAFSCLTLFSVLLAWELVDSRESLIAFGRESGQKFWKARFYKVLWGNKLLFASVVIGIVTLPLVLYVPWLNRVAFKHEGISWEWIVVLVASLLFFAGVESWKWCKRVYFRRKAFITDGKDVEDGSERRESVLTLMN